MLIMSRRSSIGTNYFRAEFVRTLESEMLRIPSVANENKFKKFCIQHLGFPNSQYFQNWHF